MGGDGGGGLVFRQQLLKHLPLVVRVRQTICISVSRGQSGFNCSFSVFSGCLVELSTTVSLPPMCVFCVFFF